MGEPPPVEILIGDVLAGLAELSAESVNCCITSPPYWGLRDYGIEGQLGLESTPELYVAKLVEVFREVRRVLKDDGTLWLNLGDTYSTGSGGTDTKSTKQRSNNGTQFEPRPAYNGLATKNLVGIPWRVAFALQADGWYLRSDIIWHKPNPMPESVTDRPTRAHEYLFLLSKSKRYYYDAKAIKESSTSKPKPKTGTRSFGSTLTGGAYGRHHLGENIPEKERRSEKQRGHSRRHAGFSDRWDQMTKAEQCATTRNKRSVWTIAPQNYRGAHFATFPEQLVEPCILAGCPPAGYVLDPFMGSGTTLAVAKRLGRAAVGIELNEEYVTLAQARIAKVIF